MANKKWSYGARFEPSVKEKLNFLLSRKYLLIAGILTVAATVLVSTQIGRITHFFTNAAVETANVFFQPASDTLDTTEKTFPVWVNAPSGATFARVTLTFDTSKITMTKDPTLLNSALTTPIQVTNMATANSTGTVVIAVAQGLGTTAPSGAFQLAGVSFKAISNSTATTSIDFNVSDMEITNPSAVDYNLSASPLSLSLNQAGTANLSFGNPVPVNPQIVGSNVSVDLLLNTAGQAVSGVDTVVQFNKTYFDFVSVTPNTASGFTSFPTSRYDAGTTTDTNGTIYLSGNVGTNASPIPVNGSAVKVGTIVLKPKAAISGNGTQLTYVFTAGNRNDSNVLANTTSTTQDPTDILGGVTPLTLLINQPGVSPSPSASVTPSVSPSPSPSVTPTPSPSPSPSASPNGVTFSFVFQGKSRTGVSKVSALTLSYIKDNQTTPTVVSLTTNAAGQANVSLGAGNYVFVIDAPGYLARKFGSTASPIVIGSTTTTIDFTGSPLLGGDLNDDGVVNEVDYTSKYLTVFGTSNALADLDGSGQVNTLDFGVMRSNWNLVNDTF